MSRTNTCTWPIVTMARIQQKQGLGDMVFVSKSNIKSVLDSPSVYADTYIRLVS